MLVGPRMTSGPMLRLAIWKRWTPWTMGTAPRGSTWLEVGAAVAHGDCGEGDHGDGDERAAESDDGRDDEEGALDGERHHVFLEEELEAVDQWLQEAEGADAGGSPAVLQAAKDFALEQDRVGDCRQRDDQHDGDL